MSEVNIKTFGPPELKVSFEEGVKLLKSGDLISFFTSHEETALHKLTSVPVLFFSGSKIYHTGIVVKITVAGEERTMVVEAVGVGRRMLNIDWFKNNRMEVHQLPSYADADKVEKFMVNYLGQGYAFFNLIIIGIREFFGANPPASKKKKVCSETAAEAWLAGGVPMPLTVLSPGKLRNVLIEMGIPPSFVINDDKGT